MSTNAQYAAAMRAKLKRWDADFDALAALVAKARNDAHHEGIEAARDLRGRERVEAARGVEEWDHAASLRTGPSTHSRT